TPTQPDIAASQSEAVVVSAPQQKIKTNGKGLAVNKKGAVRTFKAEKGARAVSKSMVGFEVVPHGDKFGLRETTAVEAELNAKATKSAKSSKAAMERKQVSSLDSLDVFVRKVGGVADGDFTRVFSGKEIGKTGNNFYGKLAHDKGLSADAVAKQAHQAGYIEEATPQALYNALEMEVKQGVMQYTPEGHNHIAEKEAEEERVQQEIEDAAFIEELGGEVYISAQVEYVESRSEINPEEGYIFIDGELLPIYSHTLKEAMEIEDEYSNSQVKTQGRQEADTRTGREDEKNSGQNRESPNIARRNDLQTKGQQALLDTGKPQVSSDAIKLTNKQNKPLDLKDENSLFGSKERAEAKAKQPDLLEPRPETASSKSLRNSNGAPTTLDDVKKSWEDKGIKHFITEDDDIITLHKIIVDKSSRGEGVGSQAMAELEDYADSKDKQVALSPSADFGGSRARLNKFYKNRGYKKNKEFTSSETLIRDPQVEKSAGKSGLKFSAKEDNKVVAELAGDEVLSLAENPVAAAKLYYNKHLLGKPAHVRFDNEAEPKEVKFINGERGFKKFKHGIPHNRMKAKLLAA
ncbi:MAG: GNAT family N-acetyltransferase, partial [Ghiorsea sp.]